jgi:hypothetical protein
MGQQSVRRIGPLEAERIVALRAEGFSLGAIAAELDLSRSTVQRFCESRHVPVPDMVNTTRDNRPVHTASKERRGMTEARARRMVDEIVTQFGPDVVAEWVARPPR